MTANLDGGSAKIYQFPARGRFASAGRLEGASPSASFLAAQAARVASASSWYHEEAVQEDRKRND
jgi:hypothetical protein